MRAHLTALDGPSRRTRSVLALVLVWTVLTAILVSTLGSPTRPVSARPAAPAVEVDTDGLQMSTGNAALDAATEFDHTHGHGPGAHEVVSQALAGTTRTATAARANTSGYTADVSAIRREGYLVVVPATLPVQLRRSIATVVGQLRTLGVPLSVVRSAAGKQNYIAVNRKTDCTGNLLGLTSRVQGGVWSADSRSWVITSYRATVGICTRTISMTGNWLTATVQHEFGHALGLGHYTSTYGGAYQIMKPVLSSGMLNFHTGDKAGVRRLVTGAPRG